MKKLCMIVSVCLMIGVFAACGTTTSSSTPSESGSVSSAASTSFDGKLEDYIEDLYAGMGENDLPEVMTAPITEELEESFLGASLDFKDAVASDAMMNAIPHSVSLVRAESEEKAAELAKVIEEKANPAKWVCVEAEKKIVKQRGNLVLLVMSQEATADKIAENFENLNP